jgi:hypothetical protein
MVNELGDGLTVIIDAQQSWLDDWMSFAAWYSFSKIIPDAIVAVSTTAKIKDCQLFSWAKQLNVRVTYTEHKDWRLKAAETFARLQCSGPLLVATPDVMAIRDLDDDAVEILNSTLLQNVAERLALSAKDDSLPCFISYRDGWGKFVVSDWINKKEVPFSYVGMFGTETPNANEVKIARMWRQLGPIYTAVSRG